jgi:hypothetical protein
MYRRSKFLELLLEIRQDMAREAGYEVDQFVQDLGVETGAQPAAVEDSGRLASEPQKTSEITKAASVSRKR